MYEIPVGRTPELHLTSFEARDLINVLRFRLRCRAEKKVGIIAMGFGQAFWVDANGEYMDDKVPAWENELADLLGQLRDAGQRT
ncbi:hypothetical protein OIU34_23220 [Pararhizobium sp. BT-229]|uniref:hypothetical protein n=1 Tax=Pararhizobium sp. BT-229 TaxID=2986923 RepID=UPI0021F71CF8|nr:hypothetical protein [Pararhizobium sp. BT-229]MCV9964807.1 hypothetical protein [Pararhizobium sp. BT-229]